MEDKSSVSLLAAITVQRVSKDPWIMTLPYQWLTMSRIFSFEWSTTCTFKEKWSFRFRYSSDESPDDLCIRTCAPSITPITFRNYQVVRKVLAVNLNTEILKHGGNYPNNSIQTVISLLSTSCSPGDGKAMKRCRLLKIKKILKEMLETLYSRFFHQWSDEC